MKIGFYPKLAARGIRNNRQTFLPFILTGTGMVMMFYIILFLAVSDSLSQVKGVETLRQIFAMGSWVIGVFAAVFLFYTNSFLTKRRKKEFGLYNILGMNKGNIGRILFWETVITGSISIVAGLTGGIAISKLAELGLVNVMRGAVTYDMSVSWIAILRSVQVFGVIFALLFLDSVRQVRFSSAVALINSEHVGEKPPKGNWFVGILGVGILAAAYYLAVTIENPISALSIFFVAVIMVIAGTYLVMIAGSVLFCRLLQKNKRYYYKPGHFVSVSSMVYRMKRNGAGLASICILATMVLVMMASTACMYFGEENAIAHRYPRDINLDFHMQDLSHMSDAHITALQDEISAQQNQRHVTPQNGYACRFCSISGVLANGVAQVDAARMEFSETVASMSIFYFVPLSDYNRVTGAGETLDPGEALLCTGQEGYDRDSISFEGAGCFKIKKVLKESEDIGNDTMDVLSGIALIVPDLENAVDGLESLVDPGADRRLLQMRWICNFDTGMNEEEQIALFRDLAETLKDTSLKQRLGYEAFTIESQEWERQDFYGLFGALFYIGIILSVVFCLAAVLIIYYKQISEGYEDQARFEIMQKVGMTKREIRKSINSQLLTVFFLPLALAACHIAFAFPMIRRILLMFHLNNVPLFAATTGISIAVFGIFYMIVYRLTSNAYYKIVSGERRNGYL